MDSAANSPSQSDLLMDRKTFFLGLFFAVVVILAGYYVLNKILANDGFRNLLQPKASSAPPSTPQAQLERSPFVVDLESDSQSQMALTASGRPKVILVHAPWCGHCRNMMGAFIQAASTHSSVEWLRADGNVAASIVRREDLRGFPTIYGVSADGNITQHVGARDTDSLIDFARKISAVNAPVPVLTREIMIQAVKEAPSETIQTIEEEVVEVEQESEDA